ncbi:type IV conjugative transfer system pilin TraA [Pectobacterium brasiliense]|uniref:type IV conjugative transfer system pilin TraA n=1 Tax=Pectobacterium brasiliense TaxID=180957 RepID=UPI0019696B67|nr:type IV conjugative transfer system pilin TraA [Pectobacterium brasiliense]MBN3262966.1 conjugal transfer protein TraA [Pectobacterium brasiliense]
MVNTGNALKAEKGRAVASLFRKARLFFQQKKIVQKGGIAFLALLATHPVLASTGDLLASQDATVTNTFGSGSSLVKWFYIAEIIMALFIYIKARSPLVFVGLVICIIFTRIGFGIAG